MTFPNFPFDAIKSEIAGSILNSLASTTFLFFWKLKWQTACRSHSFTQRLGPRLEPKCYVSMEIWFNVRVFECQKSWLDARLHTTLPRIPSCLATLVLVLNSMNGTILKLYSVIRTLDCKLHVVVLQCRILILVDWLIDWLTNWSIGFPLCKVVLLLHLGMNIIYFLIFNSLWN